MVPVRKLPVSLAAIWYVTMPLPMPLLPALMVIQAALLTAVQGQPTGKVTVILPLPPAMAKAWLVGEICGDGRLTVVAEVAELLATGSVTAELMVAVLLIVVLLPRAQSTVAVIVMVADAPAASVGKVTLRLLPEPPQMPPLVALQVIKVTEAGRLSVTTALVTASGPLLIAVRVNVSVLPTTTGLGAAVFVMVKSAVLVVVRQGENSEVLVGLVVLVAVAVMALPPAITVAKFELKLALPLPSVVTLVKPMKVCPSPLPAGSQEGL